MTVSKESKTRQNKSCSLAEFWSTADAADLIVVKLDLH